MSGPAYLQQPTIQRLPILLDEIRRGVLKLPRFQRPFVWTDEQRLLLLASIYEGLPIGSIMVWRTSRQHILKTHDRFGPFVLQPSDDAPHTGTQYLMDGHQRMATLYGALAQGFYDAPPQLPGEDQATRWPIFFDLAEERFKLPERGAPPAPRWMALDVLYNTVTFLAFQRGLALLDDGAMLIKRSEILVNRFKDYSIPIIPLVTDDLEVVTRSFHRINSQGTAMSDVHMVSALAWRDDFDLNEQLGEIRTRLSELGWGGVEEEQMLQILKIACDLDPNKSSPEAVKDQLKRHPELLQQLPKALEDAIQLFEDMKIPGPGILPYSFHLIFVTWLMLLVNGVLSAPQRKTLERWLWRTTYGQYFAGASSTRLSQTRQDIQRIAEGREDLEVLDAWLARTTVDPLDRFDFRGARSRAWAVRFAERGPLDLSGAAIDTAQVLQARDEGALFQWNTSRRQKELGKLWSTPANRILLPPEHAREFLNQLRQQPNAIAPDVLESHFFSTEAVEAILRGDWKAATELRLHQLLELERDFVVQTLGMRYGIVDEGV